MIELNSLSLSNIVTYDEASLKLDRKGLTLIYGRNKDSGHLESQSNGAGKSKLFTVMAETLCDTHPLISGRHAVKDDFYRNGASVSIDFSVEGSKYRLSKFKNGSSLKYGISKYIKGEWRDSKNREPLDMLQELFPIGVDAFFSLFYIDSSRPSLVQRGTHLTRFKLFTELFDLEAYDAVLSEVKAMIKGKRSASLQLSEVEGQIAGLEVPDSSPEELEGSLDELAEKAENTSSKLDNVNVIRGLKGVKERVAPSLEALERALGSRLSLTRDGLLKARKSTLRALREEEEKAATYEAEQTAYVKYKRKYDEYKEALSLLEDYGNPSREDLESMKKDAVANTELERRRKEISRKIKGIVLKKPSDKKPDKPSIFYSKESFSYKRKAVEAKEQLDVLNKSFKSDEECTCPTCMTKLSAKAVSNLKRSLQSSIEDYEALHTEYDELHQLRSEWDTYLESKGRKAELEEELESLVLKDVPDLETISSLSSALKVGKPAKVSKPEKPASSSSLSALLVHLDVLLNNIDSLEEADELAVDEYSDEELEEAKGRLEGRLSKLNRKKDDVIRQLGFSEKANEQLEALSSRKDELEAEVEDLPLLKILEAAYSPKGLKNIAISNLCGQLEKNLNIYAPLLYAEKVKFSLDVGDSKLNILIHRNFDGQDVSCDVRRLSGAEGRQFNLLFAMSLIPLVPARRRLNVMILDEPTANLDAAAIDLFTNQFLPKLKELVPHVIVLSPNPLPVDDSSAKVYCVVRENGKSELIEE